mmetsp:Transcript_44813/g.90528  ORF Transcript_44813/g.90528 Transcript_44813/m.90528 type:complete len:234 (+) Transcript_44813:198-899(+)
MHYPAGPTTLSLFSILAQADFHLEGFTCTFVRLIWRRADWLEKGGLRRPLVLPGLREHFVLLFLLKVVHANLPSALLHGLGVVVVLVSALDRAVDVVVPLPPPTDVVDVVLVKVLVVELCLPLRPRKHSVRVKAGHFLVGEHDKRDPDPPEHGRDAHEPHVPRPVFGKHVIVELVDRVGAFKRGHLELHHKRFLLLEPPDLACMQLRSMPLPHHPVRLVQLGLGHAAVEVQVL